MTRRGENGEKKPSFDMPPQRKTTDIRGFLKRMKGLEPSTFCMASRRSTN